MKKGRDASNLEFGCFRWDVSVSVLLCTLYDAIYFCFEHDLPKDALQQGILKLHFRE